MGTHATKVAQNLIYKYSQKLLDSANKSTANAIKSGSNRAIQKTAESTGDLISDKIAGKITSASKELHSKNNSKPDENELDIPNERYISPENI